MRKLQNLGRQFGPGQAAFNQWVTAALDAIQKASAEPYQTPAQAFALFAKVGQLPFPATQLPSDDPNVLDQYAEASFSPTFTASSGTLTTVTSDIAYVQVGRLLTLTGEISIVDAGTAAAALLMSLPKPAALAAVGSAAEVAVTGQGGRARVDPSILGASVASILKYDNTTLIATGRRIVFGLSYLVT